MIWTPRGRATRTNAAQTGSHTSTQFTPARRNSRRVLRRHLQNIRADQKESAGNDEANLLIRGGTGSGVGTTQSVSLS